MKQQLRYLALAVSALVLSACGGSMLGTSDAEDHKLIPDPVEDDLGRPRPSVNAPVITTDGAILLDATGESLLLRGINLDFAADPMERIDSIEPIRELGSNVVRLMLSPETTAQELEAALSYVVEHDLVALLSLSSEALTCNDDSQALFNAFNELWMRRWVGVLVQDRFQPHIMINLASGWGPRDIFNAHSMGYRIYTDNYKALITQFRRNGFNNPLVIDAPGCGQDYNAFLGYRGRELLAADERSNLVLSVHAYGNRWRTGAHAATNMSLLAAERLPLVMSEFGDFFAEEDAVRHFELITLGAGVRAASLTVDWQSATDNVGYLAEMNGPLNVAGKQVSVDIYFAGSYVEDGVMGLQAYMRDSAGRYANLGWQGSGNMTANGWTTLSRVIQDRSSFGWAADDFDLTDVVHIGVELVANGKSPDVRGEIMLDNIKVIEASVPEQLAFWDFEVDAGGWAPAWQGNSVDAVDGALSLVRGEDQGEMVAFVNGIPGVSYDGDIAVSLRVFIPAAYEAESGGLYFAMVSNTSTAEGGNWQATNYVGAGDFTFGEWTTLTLQGTWEGGNDLGLQMGGLGGSYEPILFDDIALMGMPAEEFAYEWGEQYRSDFSTDVDGFGRLGGWGNIPVTLTAENGALVILPRLSEVDSDGEFAISKTNLGNLETLNLASERLELTLEILFDAAYADAPSDYVFNVFIQDANWSNHTNILSLEKDDITPGEWQTVHVEVELPEAFERNLTPQYFGLQSHGLTNMPDAPITVASLVLEGDVPVESLEVVVDLVDFHYESDYERLLVDIVQGELNEAQLQEGIAPVERSRPFHWIAATWIGAAEGQEALNISESADTSVNLTERGETIVYGKGGIQETAVPAQFPEP